MILKIPKQVLLPFLMTFSSISYADSIGGAVANTTYDWAKTLTGRMANDIQHNAKRAQGKEIIRPEEARNDTSPMDDPSDWDFIESKKQKCWFHKRTRKKVCEAK